MKGLVKVAAAAAVVLIAWNLLVPSCSSSFGCEAFGTAAAHADGKGCPSSVDVAATDTEWAAARYETIKDDDLTTGLFYDEDGVEHIFRSGRDSDSEKAAEVMDDVDISNVRAATHVEVKVAARMRNNEVVWGVLIINHPGGPCRPMDGPGCQQVLRDILAPGSTLYVWWPGVDGFKKFVGK